MELFILNQLLITLRTCQYFQIPEGKQFFQKAAQKRHQLRKSIVASDTGKKNKTQVPDSKVCKVLRKIKEILKHRMDEEIYARSFFEFLLIKD